MVWSCKQNASGKLLKQAVLAKVKGKRPVGRPERTRWDNYINMLGGTTWGFNQAKCWRGGGG